MERRIKFFTALPLVMLAVSILAATTIRFETGLTPIERALLALEPERVELAGPRPVRVVRRVSSPIRKIVKRVAPAPAGRKAVKAPEVPDREAGQERAAAGPPAPAAPEVR
ncbi:MAG TPA: hypothetical protein ENJ37_01220, partial [Deltaproteobacteria bacterium]|nr:hypothetical protein [Deltaproteobacteria bacterium]